MTSTMIEQVCVPATGRDARVLTWVRDRAIDGLADRTVWCVAGLPTRAPAARETNAHLEWARDGGVATDARDITTARGAALAERLDALLRGAAAAAGLGPSERRAFAEVVDNGDRWVRDHVGPDDIVILHDALAVALTESVRARGAHAVWHLGIARARARGGRRPGARLPAGLCGAGRRVRPEPVAARAGRWPGRPCGGHDAGPGSRRHDGAPRR